MDRISLVRAKAKAARGTPAIQAARFRF